MLVFSWPSILNAKKGRQLVAKFNREALKPWDVTLASIMLASGGFHQWKEILFYRITLDLY